MVQRGNTSLVDLLLPDGTLLTIVTTAALAVSLAGCLLQGLGIGVPIQKINLADPLRQLELK